MRLWCKKWKLGTIVSTTAECEVGSVSVVWCYLTE